MLGTDAAEKLARRLWEETLRPLAEVRRDPWLRFLAHAALDSVARARRGLDAPLVFVAEDRALTPFGCTRDRGLAKGLRNMRGTVQTPLRGPWISSSLPKTRAKHPKTL